jgi:glyoxylate reductase
MTRSLVVCEEALPGPEFASRNWPLLQGRRLVDVDGSGVAALVVVHERVDESVLQRFPDLRVVARFGIGHDGIDLSACVRRGVRVGIAAGPVESATAELAVTMMLAAQWALPQWDESARRGDWSPPLVELPTASGLSGARVALLGVGKVGSLVARKVMALGAKVHYVARHEAKALSSLPATRTSLDDALSGSDIVSIHLPLTTETRGLIDASRLASMRDGALLVNTARGPVVRQSALVEELVCGRLRAALDVFDDEKVPDKLRGLRNVILTPHIGSQLRSVRLEMTRLVIATVEAGLAGLPMPYELTAA